MEKCKNYCSKIVKSVKNYLKSRAESKTSEGQLFSINLTTLVCLILIFLISFGVAYNITATKLNNIDNGSEDIVEPTKFVESEDIVAPIRTELLILEERAYYDGFEYCIKGAVRNDSIYSMSYVQITYKAYDAEGNVVGICRASRNSFRPGGVWNFKATCFADNIAYYELDKVTGF